MLQLIGQFLIRHTTHKTPGRVPFLLSALIKLKCNGPFWKRTQILTQKRSLGYDCAHIYEWCMFISWSLKTWQEKMCKSAFSKGIWAGSVWRVSRIMQETCFTSCPFDSKIDSLELLHHSPCPALLPTFRSWCTLPDLLVMDEKDCQALHIQCLPWCNF